MGTRKADGVGRVYDRVKARAMDFSFAPGQKVKEGELASEFGVSRIPVREALNRLVSEGFVTFVPNKGFFCRGIDLDEIHDLYDIRAALETWAFRAGCGRAGAADLRRFCDRWSDPATTATYASLNRYDAEFHAAMAALGGNAQLLENLRRIEERIAAFRNLELLDTDRRTKTLAEHRQIVAHLADRRGDDGARLLERHILNSAENAITAARRLMARQDA